jgi:hypothetical protein
MRYWSVELRNRYSEEYPSWLILVRIFEADGKGRVIVLPNIGEPLPLDFLEP